MIKKEENNNNNNDDDDLDYDLDMDDDLKSEMGESRSDRMSEQGNAVVFSVPVTFRSIKEWLMGCPVIENSVDSCPTP